jgi:predicted amidohydrolase YtcJ
MSQDQVGNVLLVNGRVRTLDASGAIAEAILIRNGTIEAVGTTEAVERLAPAGVRPTICKGGRCCRA